jgi:chromosome partitioning protein
MPDLYAFGSGKGGTGKTTLALAVGAVLAHPDPTQPEHERPARRVVLVDLDPQASLTEYLGVTPLRPDTGDPLTAPPVQVSGLVLLRSGRALAAASEAAISAHINRAMDLAGPAGVVLLDLSPSWSDAPHRAALSRPDLRLVLAVRLDAGGLTAARELTELARGRGLPYRLVPTFGKRWTVSQTVEMSLRAFYGEHVTAGAVPEDVKAAEAAGARIALPLYAPRARSTTAILDIAAELTAAAAGVGGSRA